MDTSILPSVDANAAAADTTSVLVDVREHDEWIRGHAPDAVHIPMSELAERVRELDRSRRIICVCRSGKRSARITSWLLQQGFDAVNLTGGMSSWSVRGHPMVNSAGDPGLVI